MSKKKKLSRPQYFYNVQDMIHVVLEGINGSPAAPPEVD